MPISLLTFNYKTTPLALREKLAVPVDAVPPLLGAAREACGLEEVMMLSTCNRVELYFTAPEAARAGRAVLDWMRRAYPDCGEELEHSALLLHGEAALTHLFRVACSLESMVIGEPQILGQVKEGYQIANAAATLGPRLHGLMQRVFHAAKRVRSETAIARFPVSISFIAAELAGRIFESLADKTVLVIGAGEMAELVVTHLQGAGVRRLRITNRTYANAVALAERFQGTAVRFDALAEELAEADVVVSSTGAQGYVVDADAVREAGRTRKGRPMFFIDIAVPRDVDPRVGELADVYCYDIDDLRTVADANHRERESEALRAQAIVAEEVARVMRRREGDAVKPVVTALRRHFVATGQQELERLLGRLEHLPAADLEALRRGVHGLVNKLLHAPSARLNALGEEGNGHLYADALRDLFALEPGAPDVTGNTRRAAEPAAAPARERDNDAEETDGTVVPFPGVRSRR